VLSGRPELGHVFTFTLWFGPQVANASFDRQRGELNVPAAVASSTLSTLLAQRF